MSHTLRNVLFVVFSLFCLIPYVTTPLALASGIIFGLLIGVPEKKSLSKYTKLLLQVSVVGLGFGIPIVEVLKAGREGIFVSFLTITIALILGTVLTRVLKVKNNTGTLISVGTAICGGSAIAAVAPVIHADHEDVSVSMAVVFALNAIALFLFPWIGHQLHLLPEQFGLWSALAIHDTSSVVGASSLFGEKALAIATTVKLSRAMWILPIALMYTFLRHAKNRVAIPWFILFFVLAAGVNSLLPQYKTFFVFLSSCSKQALCLVLFWIGSSMNAQSFKRVGWRPFALAISLWVCLGLGTLYYV